MERDKHMEKDVEGRVGTCGSIIHKSNYKERGSWCHREYTKQP